MKRLGTTGPGKLLMNVRDDGFRSLIIALFFAGGVAGHYFRPAAMPRLTPSVLWVFGLFVTVRSLRGGWVEDAAGRGRRARGEESDWAAGAAGRERRARLPVRELVWIAATSTITFILEAVGVHTGAVFGDYSYGDVLGFSLFSVPLVIGFNWVLVVLGGLRAVQNLPGWAAVPSAAGITVIFDWILEPLAIRLGYWSWNWDGVPLQNYLAWFIISMFAAALFRMLKLRLDSRLPLYYLVIQASFFIALRAVMN